MGSTVYTESYTYEAADGALNSYTNALGQSIDLTYDGLRRVEKVDTPLLDRTYTYLNVANSTTKTTGLVSGYTYKNSAGTALFTYGYTYDSVGNIATYNQNGTNWTYTYDAQNQLLSAASGSTTYSYSYDNVGNITSANGKSYTYGNSLWFDLLTAYDGQYIQYEGQQLSGSTVSGNPKSGNPISYYNGKRYTFDWEEGRNLVSVSGGAVAQYQYDLSGLRVSKTTGGKVHEYLYAGGKLMRETISASGSVTDTLDFFYDQNGYPYALKYNGTLYYYVTNLQGDVLHLTNTSGTTVVSYSYDPYGKLLNTTGSLATTLGAANPLRYRGYYYDTETGFYYLQSRYYDPAICRFINADSYASTGQGMLGNNMFAYCNNSPIVCYDPTGFSLTMTTNSDDNPNAMRQVRGGGAGGLAIALVCLVVAAAYINTQAQLTYGVLDIEELLEEKMVKSLAKAQKTEYDHEKEEHHVIPKGSSKAAIATAIVNDVIPNGVENPVNKVMVSTKIHKRLHSNLYYGVVNYFVIGAYLAVDDEQKRTANVYVAIISVRVIVEMLDKNLT